MTQLPALTPVGSFKSDVYRNIYTAVDAQDLFDDLDVEPEDYETLYAWDNASSGIDHTEPAKNRVFQYHDPATSSLAVFNDGVKPVQSRFSDGTYGVWYGALEEQTSIRETLYHALRFAKEDLANAKDGSIKVERVMFLVKCATDKSVDLRAAAGSFPDLAHPTDYSFCQRVGAAARASGIEVLQTISVRNAGGVCIPVFTPNAIDDEKRIRYYRYQFEQDGKVIITTINNQTFDIPKEWGLT